MEHEFTSVSADLLEPTSRQSRAIVYAIGSIIAAAVIWSWFATVIEVSTGSGHVIPERRLQVVQSLEGGVVGEILAKPGDTVHAGDIIARLDPTYARSAYDETAQQIAGLEGTAVRLRTQLSVLDQLAGGGESLGRLDPASGKSRLVKVENKQITSDAIMAAARNPDLHFSTFLKTNHADLVRQNTELFQTGLQELSGSLSAVEEQIAQKKFEGEETRARLQHAETALKLAREEQKAMERLLKAGAAGKAEVSAAKTRTNDFSGQAEQARLTLPRLESAVAELNGRIEERLSNFRTRTAEQLNEAGVRQSALEATLTALVQRAANTQINAPASGILKSMTLTTKGQVVKPGEAIAEIIPSDSTLLIQIRVRPEDIAFIEPGMPAMIKLTAYDYSIFGSVPGTVERIAGDSTTDEKGTTYYLVDIRASSDHVQRQSERWPIKAGMVATVDIVTGKQSVFQYFTKPIHKMTQMALRER